MQIEFDSGRRFFAGGDKHHKVSRSTRCCMNGTNEHVESSTSSRTESLYCTSFGSYGLSFSIPGRCARLERAQKASRYVRDLINRRKEQLFVRFRRLVEPADLAHKLQRSRPYLFGSDGRFEVKQ